jgi:hypothetical protein
MKNIYTILFLLFCMSAFAQPPLNAITYTYDAAGNRIQKRNPGSGPSNPGGEAGLLAEVDTTKKTDSVPAKHLLTDNEFIDLVKDDKKSEDKKNNMSVISSSTNIDATNTSDNFINPSITNSSNPNEVVFTISPNPVRDQFTLSQNQSLPDLITSITIYNSQGKIIQTLYNVNTPLVLNVSSYEVGTYYVQIVLKSKTYSLKFIKG